MKKKKIAMILVTQPKRGGGHQYALMVAKCLKELPASKYELVSICNNSFWTKWSKENGITYFHFNEIEPETKNILYNLKFPFFSRIYNLYVTELGRIVRKEKIDVLFATAQMYVPNLNVKIILPVHDLMHRYENSFPEVKNEYYRREAVFKVQARFADYIFTDSDLGKKQFEEAYLKKYTKKPNIVVLPFVVSDHISKMREKYVEVPFPYVFYPAQFWMHKNHINLIKAIQILKKEIEEIHLVLVGCEKNCLREIKKYIVANGLDNNVTIKGFVSDENITFLYRHALGMIMPSYFGPTNIPPLEAMALGCPVAVSDRYAMPEQVGDAGLLFDPDSPDEIADCIRKIWTDAELREELIGKGYRKISTWTERDFRKKVLKVVKRCCNDIK